jgi:hypothetical protein
MMAVRLGEMASGVPLDALLDTAMLTWCRENLQSRMVQHPSLLMAHDWQKLFDESRSFGG